MKLYANVRSDRATKHQGGNNFIEIELLVGDKENPIQFAVINLSRQRGDVSHLDPNSYELTVVTDYQVNAINSKGYSAILKRAEIGKRQKGEGENDCIYDHEHGDGSKCEYHSL